MEQKVVVITGASAGIGAALAKELSMKTHSLALAARREGELRAVAEAAKTRAISDVTRRAAASPG
jgi:NADP-dependent 3-hydroxy acid dehydrogenase YdfG